MDGTEARTPSEDASQEGFGSAHLDRAVSVQPPLETWLEAVGDIARSVTTSSSLVGILDLIAETICRLMRYDFCAVLLADDERKHLVVEGWHGLSAEYVALVNKEKLIRLGPGSRGHGPSSRAFLSGEPTVVTDAAADPSFGPWAGVAFDQGYRSMLAVPMAIAGRSPVGTLNCYTSASHDFPRAEVSLLRAMANQAAIAIEAARLHAQEREQIEELQQLNHSLEAQGATLRRTEHIHRELTEVALAEKGLPAVAGVLAHLLRSAVVIENAEGQKLGAADGYRPASSVTVQRDLHGLPGVAEALSEIETTRQVVELAVELPRPDTQSQRAKVAVAPVILDGRLVAQIWALDLDSTLDQIGRRTLEHGAIVVAHELLKLRAAQEAEWRLRSDLLNDLLEDSHPRPRRTATPGDHEVLQARSAQLGHDLTLPHTLLLVRFDGSQDGKEHTDAALHARHPEDLVGLVQRLTASMDPRPLVTVRNDAIVVLVPKVADPQWESVISLAHNIRRETVRIMRTTVSVAVGNEVNEQSRYPVAYRQAHGVLDLAAAQGANDTVVAVEDLGLYAHLLLVDEPSDLSKFARDRLHPLEDYDESHHGELVKTLRSYLDHGFRMQDTASTLYVHVNTLSQRLRRIEELSEVDLKAPQTLLEFHLALMVKDLVSAGLNSCA